MALSPNTVWEVRATGGDDTFGGGYVAGTGGTGVDYSQQTFAQLSLTDLAAAQNSTTVTSTTGGFTSQMVDNLLHVNVAGTNFVVGWYWVKTFVDTHTITVDRAPATAGAGSGASGKIGGALATINKLATGFVSGNEAWLNGAFTSSATIVFSMAASNLNRLTGYGSARGDSGHATLTLQTNTGLIGLNFTGAEFEVSQIDVNCSLLTNSIGIQLNSAGTIGSMLFNCKVMNFTTHGIISTGAGGNVFNCEVTGGNAAYPGTAIFNIAGSIVGCYVHDNSSVGIRTDSGNSTVVFNVVANNTGNGIQLNFSTTCLNNTVHGNGGTGIVVNAGTTKALVKNNIITNNGNVGFVGSSIAPIGARSFFDGNAYFNNTGGARANADSTSGIYGVSPYTNVLDIILGASPYIGPTTGVNANFGLNDVSGAGAACRWSGFLNTFPGSTATISYTDLGAVQVPPTGISKSRLIGGV